MTFRQYDTAEKTTRISYSSGRQHAVRDTVLFLEITTTMSGFEEDKEL